MLGERELDPALGWIGPRRADGATVQRPRQRRHVSLAAAAVQGPAIHSRRRQATVAHLQVAARSRAFHHGGALAGTRGAGGRRRSLPRRLRDRGTQVAGDFRFRCGGGISAAWARSGVAQRANAGVAQGLCRRDHELSRACRAVAAAPAGKRTAVPDRDAGLGQHGATAGARDDVPPQLAGTLWLVGRANCRGNPDTLCGRQYLEALRDALRSGEVAAA